jgi:hypothetical protein
MPHAKIASHQAVYTLDQLHAELAGKILDNKAEADRLREAMVHVEAVIKLLDPTHNLRVIAVRRRKPNCWFKRGTVWRTALDVLRQADAPLTVGEIAERMLAAKRIVAAPRSAVENLEGAVRAGLRNHQDNGVFTAGYGTPLRWLLKNS